MEAPGKQGNILVVDSDTNIVRLLRYNLSTEGFNVVVNKNASDISPDDLTDVRLVIVDAMEQLFSGHDLINKIKTDPSTDCIPIIMCSESQGDDFVVETLNIGADDFIIKPFSLRELLARVNALLRRYPRQPIRRYGPRVVDEIEIRHLELKINTFDRRVEKAGEVIPLTRTEFAILEFLVKHENTFFTRDKIYDEIWKDDAKASPRIVDTNISRLRKKLGDASKLIVNRYGMGYAFSEKA